MLSLIEIKHLLKTAAASGPGLLGAQAGQLLREADPDFRISDYGVRSLSELIARHVTELVPISSSGADRRYGLAEQATIEASTEPERYLWQVWASPNTPFALRVDKRTGATVACRADEHSDETYLVLRSPDDAASREIASSFLAETAELDPDLRGDLEKIESSADPHWWRLWQYTLRRRAAGQFGAWHGHRRQRLATLLADGLRAGGLTATLVETVVSTVTSSRGSRGVKHIAQARRDTPANLHELVISLVPRLSEDQLRMMTLPIGVVLDALGIDLKGLRQ